MDNVIGKTSDGREIRERQDYKQAGDCAECGRHVDPYDPALWNHLTETGLETRTDERGLTEDEKLEPGEVTDSMGGEMLEDSPGGRFASTSEEAKRGVLKKQVDWDGSCFYCGASAERVGRAV